MYSSALKHGCSYYAPPISHQNANAAVPSGRVSDSCPNYSSIYHSTDSDISRTPICTQVPSSMGVHITRRATLFYTLIDLQLNMFLVFDNSASSVASDVLQEIMTRSSLSGGAGTSTSTESLLIRLNEDGDRGKPHHSRTLTLL